MNVETAAKAFIGAMIVSGVAMVGFNIVMDIRSRKLNAAILADMKAKREQSEKMMKETFKHASRVFKSADAQASTYEDIIDGIIIEEI